MKKYSHLTGRFKESVDFTNVKGLKSVLDFFNYYGITFEQVEDKNKENKIVLKSDKLTLMSLLENNKVLSTPKYINCFMDLHMDYDEKTNSVDNITLGIKESDSKDFFFCSDVFEKDPYSGFGYSIVTQWNSRYDSNDACIVFKVNDDSNDAHGIYVYIQ